MLSMPAPFCFNVLHYKCYATEPKYYFCVSVCFLLLQASAHSHFSFFLSHGTCFSTKTPESIQQQDGGSRGKVSLERVYRLTLTLGLYFSECMCVQEQLPCSLLQRVFTFFGEVFISPKLGVPLGKFTESKGRVLSHTHPSQLHSGPMPGAAVFSLRAQTFQK